jgi:N-acetylmuramoyl-L-alanine amidase
MGALSLSLHSPLKDRNSSEPVRHQTLQSIQRYLVIISFLACLGIGSISLRIAGYDLSTIQTWLPPGLLGVLFNRQIALISGHAGNDSGAICTDAAGQVIVTEAKITATITELVANQLRRAGAQVVVLDEFDSRLAGLQTELLVSVHADSCIEASGYKFALSNSSAFDPAVATRLGACFDQFYAEATGLAPHPNTITHNMTDYHAFRRIDAHTPALILEAGFIGGDQQLLVKDPERVARGIIGSIRCFFESSSS